MDTPNSPTPLSKPEGQYDASMIDLRVRQFGVVAGYLQYENSVYWTRSQLFLVGNSALVGLLATALPLTASVSWSRIYTLAVAFTLGLILCILWLKILLAACGWIDHWHKQLRHLEQTAFPPGTLTPDGEGLFRNVNSIEARGPIKKWSLCICWSFIAIWVLALSYLAVVAAAKALSMELL